MEKKVGIIDEPVASGGEDSLDINVHAESLTRYVRLTNTPITIGIQGEWGSGKTSLINSIYHEFDSSQEYKQIWINSWEYSLLSTPEESLLKIVNRIIDELLDADKNKARKDKIQNGAKKIFSGALRVGAQLALGSEAAAVAGELMSGGEASIGALRSQLSELVLEIEKRDTNPYKKIIIYVDDLDRIEPKNAVAILELLKNIFSVPNCVFILAIDYQVVVKGLEHKFGKQTPENEWEFRAFFDKIIQLPFMMPMGQYNIGKYVNKLLIDIGFVENDGLDEYSIREIITRTIGGNPRSIKRLVNSVSLIQIFSDVKLSKEVKFSKKIDEKDEEVSDEQKKFLLFSLLCLQIAYPAIYSLLNIKPDFTSWDADFAFSETKKKEESEPEFETEFKNALQTEDFDEEWEKCLYRICYIRPRLKIRSPDISKFFSYIKDELLNDQQSLIGETIADILSQTSVTSVTSSDQQQSIPSTKSKIHDEEQVNYLATFKSEVLLSMKENNSKIYGIRNPGKSFSWYMRFQCPANIFSDPKFTPGWAINFFLDLRFWVNIEEIDENIKINDFFKNNFLSLKSELKDFGDLYFKDSNPKILEYGLLRNNYKEIKNIEKKNVTDLVENNEHRINAIQWSTNAGIKFENIIINVFQDLINKHGSISKK